jgi:hypothetical protein
MNMRASKPLPGKCMLEQTIMACNPLTTGEHHSFNESRFYELLMRHDSHRKVGGRIRQNRWGI